MNKQKHRVLFKGRNTQLQHHEKARCETEKAEMLGEKYVTFTRGDRTLNPKAAEAEILLTFKDLNLSGKS